MEFALDVYPGEPLSLLEINMESIPVQIDDRYTDGMDTSYGHAFCTLENIPPNRIRVVGKFRRSADAVTHSPVARD